MKNQQRGAAVEEKARIDFVPLDEVKRWPRNPKSHDLKTLRRSIERFGFVQPLIVDETSGRIVAGHGRLEALIAMHTAGCPAPKRIRVKGRAWLVPVLRGVSFDSEKEAEAYLVADNRIVEMGGWDLDLLAPMVEQFYEEPDVLAAMGYTTSEVDLLLDRVSGGQEDDEASFEPAKNPTTKIGDVWTLGKHRILCGDSTEKRAWDRLLRSTVVDMVWTDPPYGVEYEGAAGKIQNDEIDEAKLEVLLRAALGQVHERCRPGASWYVAAPAGPNHLAFAKVLRELEVWRQTIQWVKDSLVLGRSDYHYRNEPIFYGWKKGAAHYFVDDRTQDTVWEIPRPKRSVDHPTMKPVELVARALRNSSKRGEVVVDPFMGSGTTLIAAEKEHRVAMGIELSPAYVEGMVRRWELETGKQASVERS